MSYRNLDIWKLAHELVIEIHEVSLKLPRHELYEEGSQIRKSIKNVKSTIVEGYGRRRYKSDFIKFLIYAQASNDETIDHLENLWETRSLNDGSSYERLRLKLEILGKKLNLFIKGVEKTAWY